MLFLYLGSNISSMIILFQNLFVSNDFFLATLLSYIKLYNLIFIKYQTKDKFAQT